MRTFRQRSCHTPTKWLSAVLIVGLLGEGDGARVYRSSTVRSAVPEEKSVDDFGIDEATWLGDEEGPQDLCVTAQNQTGIVAAANASVAENYPPGTPPILILGMFHTGTNLLEDLIQKNFPGLRKPGERCGWGREAGVEIYKHIKPSHLAGNLRSHGTPHLLRRRGFVAITTIRDPMSWLQSMVKAGYLVEGCMKGTDWPTRSCEFQRPVQHDPSVWWRSPVKGKFHVENVEQLWNQWHWEYDHLDAYGFAPGKVVSVSYEELVLNTWGALKKIADATGQPMPSSVKHVQEPAVPRLKHNGRQAALLKLRTKSYLQRYTKWERTEACRRLSKELMHKHGYHDCDGWQ